MNYEAQPSDVFETSDGLLKEDGLHLEGGVHLNKSHRMVWKD